MEQDLKQVTKALPKVFIARRKHAAKAKVIVLGYPNFMPASGDCRPVGGTLKYLVKMPSESVEFIHGKIDELDRDIRAAARRVTSS